MKKITVFALCFLMVAALFPVLITNVSAATDKQGLTYALSEDETYYIVASCDTSATSIVIPAEYNGKPVKVIGEKAFELCVKLENIYIPDSVTKISDFGFYYCTMLQNFQIPDSVTEIGYGAFWKCATLTDVEIPDSVIHLGDYAFRSCSELKTIKLSNSIEIIGDSTFYQCDNLKSIIIPDSVTKIASSAFMDCQRLNEVQIPDSVTEIGEEAFYGCYKLESIEIPDSVVNMGYRVFYQSEIDIYCQFASRPSTWDEKWVSPTDNRITVHWLLSDSEIEQTSSENEAVSSAPEITDPTRDETDGNDQNNGIPKFIIAAILASLVIILIIVISIAKKRKS